MAKAKSKDPIRLYLDPGHGLPDPGAVGPTGLQEQAVTLEVCKLIKSMLEVEGGWDVKLSRETANMSGAPGVLGGNLTKASSMSLIWRVNDSRAFRPAMFLCVHCNAAADRSAHGFEVFYNRGKGEVAGAAMFKAMKDRLTSHTPRKCVPETFYVLRKIAEIPSLLVELEFISNVEQEAKFKDPEALKFYAETLIIGLKAALL